MPKPHHHHHHHHHHHDRDKITKSKKENNNKDVLKSSIDKNSCGDAYLQKNSKENKETVRHPSLENFLHKTKQLFKKEKSFNNVPDTKLIMNNNNQVENFEKLKHKSRKSKEHKHKRDKSHRKSYSKEKLMPNKEAANRVQEVLFCQMPPVLRIEKNNEIKDLYRRTQKDEHSRKEKFEAVERPNKEIELKKEKKKMRKALNDNNNEQYNKFLDSVYDNRKSNNKIKSNMLLAPYPSPENQNFVSKKIQPQKEDLESKSAHKKELLKKKDDRKKSPEKKIEPPQVEHKIIQPAPLIPQIATENLNEYLGKIQMLIDQNLNVLLQMKKSKHKKKLKIDAVEKVNKCTETITKEEIICEVLKRLKEAEEAKITSTVVTHEPTIEEIPENITPILNNNKKEMIPNSFGDSCIKSPEILLNNFILPAPEIFCDDDNNNNYNDINNENFIVQGVEPPTLEKKVDSIKIKEQRPMKLECKMVSIVTVPPERTEFMENLKKSERYQLYYNNSNENCAKCLDMKSLYSDSARAMSDPSDEFDFFQIQKRIKSNLRLKESKKIKVLPLGGTTEYYYRMLTKSQSDHCLKLDKKLANSHLTVFSKQVQEIPKYEAKKSLSDCKLIPEQKEVSKHTETVNVTINNGNAFRNLLQGKNYTIKLSKKCQTEEIDEEMDEEVVENTDQFSKIYETIDSLEEKIYETHKPPKEAQNAAVSPILSKNEPKDIAIGDSLSHHKVVNTAVGESKTKIPKAPKSHRRIPERSKYKISVGLSPIRFTEETPAQVTPSSSARKTNSKIAKLKKNSNFRASTAKTTQVRKSQVESRPKSQLIKEEIPVQKIPEPSKQSNFVAAKPKKNELCCHTNLPSARNVIVANVKLNYEVSSDDSMMMNAESSTSSSVSDGIPKFIQRSKSLVDINPEKVVVSRSKSDLYCLRNIVVRPCLIQHKNEKSVKEALEKFNNKPKLGSLPSNGPSRASSYFDEYLNTFSGRLFLTKDYKLNTMSSYQRRKLYDQARREKLKKINNKEPIAPQVYEVHYVKVEKPRKKINHSHSVSNLSLSDSTKSEGKISKEKFDAKFTPLNYPISCPLLSVKSSKFQFLYEDSEHNEIGESLKNFQQTFNCYNVKYESIPESGYSSSYSKSTVASFFTKPEIAGLLKPSENEIPKKEVLLDEYDYLSDDDDDDDEDFSLEILFTTEEIPSENHLVAKKFRLEFPNNCFNVSYCTELIIENIQTYSDQDLFTSLVKSYENETDVLKKLRKNVKFIETLANKLLLLPQKEKKKKYNILHKIFGKPETAEKNSINTLNVNNEQDELKATLITLSATARKRFNMLVEADKINENIDYEFKICSLNEMIKRIEKGDFTLTPSSSSSLDDGNLMQNLEDDLVNYAIKLNEFCIKNCKKFKTKYGKLQCELIQLLVLNYRMIFLINTDYIAKEIAKGVIQTEDELKNAVRFTMKSEEFLKSSSNNI